MLHISAENHNPASVTSPGFESAGLGGLASSLDGSALVPQLGAAAVGAGLGLVDDLNYADTLRRGYLVMTVTAASVKGEYVYVPSPWLRLPRQAPWAPSATPEAKTAPVATASYPAHSIKTTCSAIITGAGSYQLHSDLHAVKPPRPRRN